jgi:hypothetical protein
MRLFAAAALLLCCMVPQSSLHAQPPPPGYGGGGEAVECVSRNFAFTRCDVPWRDVRLVRQLSDTACVRGQNWGLDRRGLWVDRGCGGRFVAVGNGPGYGGGSYPPPGWDSRFAVRCGSDNYRYRFCAVDLGGGGRAYIDRQISGSACIEGRTWGWNRGGIWVDQGCEAVFTIDRRWR